jgi:periodic tryptophan protein 1
MYDVRTHSATKQNPVWLLQAHDAGISTFDVSPTNPGLFVTGSTDKLVKLWHVAPSQRGPSLVLSRDLDLGKIFSTQFGPDPSVGMKVAVAGSAGSVKIWDLSTSSAARKAFGVSGKAKEVAEEGKVVGIIENSEDDHDEDEENEDGWGDMDDN